MLCLLSFALLIHIESALRSKTLGYSLLKPKKEHMILNEKGETNSSGEPKKQGATSCEDLTTAHRSKFGDVESGTSSEPRAPVQDTTCEYIEDIFADLKPTVSGESTNFLRGLIGYGNSSQKKIKSETEIDVILRHLNNAEKKIVAVRECFIEHIQSAEKPHKKEQERIVCDEIHKILEVLVKLEGFFNNCKQEWEFHSNIMQREKSKK